MKFNIATKGKKQLRNYEGANAWRLSPELELYSAVVTASLSDKFYESGDQRLTRIRELIPQVHPIFVAKLAVYAREKMHLRSIPLVLAVELAREHRGDSLVSKLVDRIIRRADEITELLAAYQSLNDRKGLKKLNKLSKQVQKGLAKAFNRFDEYQFAKYDRKAEIRLRDALFLVHPKAKDEAQQALFDKITTSSLETPFTWETQLSQAGQETYASEAEKRAAFARKWESMIRSGKLGYMALLRNLRNLIEYEVDPGALRKAASWLADPTAVSKSRQFPFRFLSAYRELKKVSGPEVPMFLDALEKAMVASAKNIKGFGRSTRVLIAADMSGSMQSGLSGKSAVMMYEVGLILAMLLQNRSERVQTGLFGESWKTISLPRSGILANADALANRIGEVGHATNGHLILEDLIRRKAVVDKVMIFTDMQLWNSQGWNSKETIAELWPVYKRLAPKAKLYLFDLNGYGQFPLRQEKGDVFLIAGWSEKVFEAMEAIEKGDQALSLIWNIEI